ncbi:MAG: hypothetical protein WCE69_02330, partial [Aestuariivirga sp.]
ILALAMANPILIDFRNLFSIQEADSFGIKYMSLGRKPVAISRQHAGSMVVNYVSTGDDRSPFHAKGI